MNLLKLHRHHMHIQCTTLDEYLRTPSTQRSQMDISSNITTSSPFGQYVFPNVQTTPYIASSSIPIATINSKVSLTKYGGYSHEDSNKFIKEFNSYCTFNGITMQEELLPFIFLYSYKCGHRNVLS
jgi:hypothetical protein